MNRAARRHNVRAARAVKWRTLSRQFRGLADNPLVPIADRRALRDAAARLDRGERPALVVARISATLARISAMTAEGELP